MAPDEMKPSALSGGSDLRAKAPVDLQIGEVIAGKYSIEGLLGRGGMGTVWLCTHLALHERVAVKVMSRQMADNDEVRVRFAREARASAKIKSRYVARVYDTGEFPDGRPYLVMEYMDGETLGQALQASHTMSLADTVRILGQVGRGLARAHELGIVHRDIKPDNVFLAHTSDDGLIAKVFDFGIVKVSEAIAVAPDTTQEGALLGTPQYMSPEQVEGVAIDHRSDVYALGVMAFRMLTGKRLFPGEALSATLMKICNGPLPSLAALAPELPLPVDAWFQRTCARRREDRFSTALECVDSLASAAGMQVQTEVTLPPPPVAANVSGVVPALTARPPETETPTGLSAVQSSSPPLAGMPPTAEDAPEASPRLRRGVAILAAVAAAGLLALFVLSRTSRAPLAGDPVAATSGPAQPPSFPAPSASEVAAAPSALPAVAAPIASSVSDAATRSGWRASPSRGRGAHPVGSPAPKADTPSPPDERIHDVGY